GSPTLPSRGHPRRRPLPAQVADRVGPADPVEPPWRDVRLADLRRRLRGGRAVPGHPEPRRPAVRGGTAGELRGPGYPGRGPVPRGPAPHRRRRGRRASLPTGPPTGVAPGV